MAPKLEKAHDSPYVVKVKMSKIDLVIQVEEEGKDVMNILT